MDAALHGSGNQIFVAPFSGLQREAVEKALIYWEQPRYNRQGKLINLGDLSQSSHIGPESCPFAEPQVPFGLEAQVV